MKILNLHGFLGEADNKNYKALCGLLSAECIISPQLDYKNSAPKEILDALSAQAFVLCSDADTVIPDNYANCIALAQTVQRVSGSHSAINGLQAHLADMLARME